MTKLVKLIFLSICAVLILPLSSINAVVVRAEEYSNSALAMALLEKSSGRILDSKNANMKLPMASTTKIITAITAIEKEQNLDRVIEVPIEAVGVEGSSVYLRSGEMISIRSLLYGLMLRSGNDCAVALAISISGSVEKFVQSMNETAKRVGANDTNLVNPHGLQAKNHYTSAKDLGLISAYAMKNEQFREIVSTKRFEVERNGQKEVWINKNKILSTLDGGDGIKTGYTTTAGRCLVASATRNGMTVIAVVLNCRPMFVDCEALIEKAFFEYKLYSMRQLIGKGINAEVEGGKSKTVSLGIYEEVFYPLRESEARGLSIEVNGVEKMHAPVKSGIENGKISICYQNRLLFEEKLYTINSVSALSVSDRLSEIISEWTGA